MKATGIIVEYNPFHNGHYIHAKQSKEQTNSDIVIAVMSGSFLQRGEPAFVDKWTRTQMALKNGVDLVFELPYLYATAHAPVFAEGAITLLDGLLCKHFCFGSEDGHIEPFVNSLQLINAHKSAYEQSIHDAMDLGTSYPQALAYAYQKIQQNVPIKHGYVDLTKPNNILGFHYIQAAAKIQSNMQPETIQRVGAQYHDEAFTDQKIGSATAIRKQFFQTDTMDNIAPFMPTSAQSILEHYHETKHTFAHWQSFYPILRTIILRDGVQKIQTIADLTEGIENVIYRAALAHDEFHHFMIAIKSKRYTWTRIQRMLTHIYTGFTKAQRETIQDAHYLRLLGMTTAGRHYLNHYKKAFKYPLISKASAFHHPGLMQDIQASNLYYLGLNQPEQVNSDYSRSPIYCR